MGRIAAGAQRTWSNGDIVSSSDYNLDRSLLTTAINDNQDQLDALHGTTGAGLVGATTTGVNGATVQANLTDLKAQIDTKANTTSVPSNTALASTDSVTNGATLVGSGAIAGVTGSTVFAQLQSLKALINQASVGAIPDGSLGPEKLNFTPLKSTDEGAPNGVATLDSNGHVVSSQLNIGSASTTQAGIVQLYDGTDSTDATKAATAHAVNQVYVVATTQATTSQAGIVQLVNAVNSTDATKAATAAAVKSAYDLANTANSKSVNLLNNPYARLRR